MLKVLGVDGDKFRIVDLEDLKDEESVSAEQLVLLLAKNEFEGCKHSRNGIEVWYDGVEPYEIPIEVWKSVPIYNTKTENGSWRYWVSNLGRVASSSYIDERGNLRSAKLRCCTVNSLGYRAVTVRKNNKNKTLRVCRIVALAFLPNPNKYPIINHKNEIKSEDWCGNLEWCTVLYNNLYNGAQLRRNAKLKKSVRQYSLLGIFVAEFSSLDDARIALNLTTSIGISNCCRRSPSYRHASGYVWRFTTDDELYGLTGLEVGNILRFVRKYDASGKFIAEYGTLSDAANGDYNTKKSINVCCLGGSTLCRGFKWRYSDNDELSKSHENAEAIEEWRVRQNAET